MITPNRAGRGSRRMICQATMLIGSILRAGETANDSVVPRQPALGKAWHSRDDACTLTWVAEFYGKTPHLRQVLFHDLDYDCSYYRG